MVRDSTTGVAYALKRMTCHGRAELALAQAEAARHRALPPHANLVPLIDDATMASRRQPGATDVCLLFPLYEVGGERWSSLLLGIVIM